MIGIGTAFALLVSLMVLVVLIRIAIPIVFRDSRIPLMPPYPRISMPSAAEIEARTEDPNEELKDRSKAAAAAVAMLRMTSTHLGISERNDPASQSFTRVPIPYLDERNRAAAASVALMRMKGLIP